MAQHLCALMAPDNYDTNILDIDPLQTLNDDYLLMDAAQTSESMESVSLTKDFTYHEFSEADLNFLNDDYLRMDVAQNSESMESLFLTEDITYHKSSKATTHESSFIFTSIQSKSIFGEVWKSLESSELKISESSSPRGIVTRESTNIPTSTVNLFDCQNKTRGKVTSCAVQSILACKVVTKDKASTNSDGYGPESQWEIS
jgi:hypothetical protein